MIGTVSKKLYFLSVGFLQEAGPRFLPASWRISAGNGTRVRLRSSLSQFRSLWSGLPPTGPKTRTRSSYAAARFASRIRSSVTDGGASRRTTSITTGSGFVVAAVSDAEGRLPSCRCFLFHTRTTACWRAASHFCSGWWSLVRGRRQYRSARILIGSPIHRRCAAGRLVWIAAGRGIRFSISFWSA